MRQRTGQCGGGPWAIRRWTVGEEMADCGRGVHAAADRGCKGPGGENADFIPRRIRVQLHMSYLTFIILVVEYSTLETRLASVKRSLVGISFVFSCSARKVRNPSMSQNTREQYSL